MGELGGAGSMKNRRFSVKNPHKVEMVGARLFLDIKISNTEYGLKLIIIQEVASRIVGLPR